MKQEVVEIDFKNRFTTKPGIISTIVLFITIVLWTVPGALSLLTDKADTSILAIIFLAPIAYPISALGAYFTGLNIVKRAYNRKIRGKQCLKIAYRNLIGLNILCFGACMLYEFICPYHTPLHLSFDYTFEVTILDAIITYSITSAILFIPAYISTYRCYRYLNKKKK